MTMPVAHSPSHTAPSFAQARAAFAETLIGRSPASIGTYVTALDRFAEYLDDRRIADTTPTSSLPTDVLERFYPWLVRRYGREARATHLTYIAGTSAFFRFLERRGWSPAGTTFERMRAGLREIVGRASYKTPRIDPALPLIVTYVDSLPVPKPDGRNGRQRLELLRDKALVWTLYATGMRRQEVASLNRADIADGWQDQAIITGKGSKERVVFFDEPTLAAIRDYLAARADTWAPLFIRHDKSRGRPRQNGVNFRLHPHRVYLIVVAYAKVVGVDATPHDFRHTKASVMLNAGASLSEVQDILGHASPETTKRIYAHYETSRLREAFDRYSIPPEELARRIKQRGQPGERRGDS